MSLNNIISSQVIVYPDLPLAIYREIAAHLQQVKGVSVSLNPQTSPNFSYQTSQIEALELEYTADFEPSQKVEVQGILDYYAQRHGNYQVVPPVFSPQSGQETESEGRG